MGIDWQKVREDFERGDISIRGLAKRYGCHESTVRRRAKKEGWRRRDGTSMKGGSEEKPENLLHEHRRLWKGVKKKLIKGLEESDHDELRIAKTACEVLSNVVKGERQAWGLEEYCDRELLDDAEEITKEMVRSTVPPGTDPSVDRG